MLNASVGVQRVVGRMRRPPSIRVASARTAAVSLVAALEPQRRLRAAVAASRLTPRQHRFERPFGAHLARQARITLIARIGHERVVALMAAAILLGASVVSVTTSRPAPATGDTTAPGSDVRLTVGGDAGITDGGITDTGIAAGVEGATQAGTIAEAEPPDLETLSRIGAIDDPVSASGIDASIEAAAAAEVGPIEEPASPEEAVVEGPFLEDGTLLKPFAVDTTVADGRALLQTYTVRSGDTLTGIADHFGVSMMTLWWANNLKSKDDLHLGQVLTIPPVSGLVLTVTATDTLASLAAKYEVEEQAILDANNLTDPNLVVGQVLAIPGALGKAIVTPKPAPSTRSNTSSAGRSSGSSRAPTTYSGGAFSWPVSGGGNYISQYYHYGHYGIDIAADYGSSIRAAASGTVIFAGWKGNGGGYQVWVAHGSGLYSTYNHMSAISVGSGQHVSEGERVGRIGQSGRATGPHLHFEVWRGGVWSGGSRVNPLAFL